MSSSRLITIYRKSLISLAVLFVIGLAWLDISPLGHLHITAEFGKDSSFVSQVVPIQRTQGGKRGVVVFDEPVYFTLRYPRPFETAITEVQFENPANVLVELGPQNSGAESFERWGINHPGLNQLMGEDGWERAAILEENGTTLWQRRSADYLYRSPEQFLSQLPDQERTAYYGMDWPKPYLPDFKRKQQPTSQVLNVPLVGSHVLYAATDQDAISFHLDVVDANRNEGADEALFQIKTWEGAVLAEQQLTDDGNVSGDGRFSSPRTVDLVYTGLSKPQVLQLTISGTNDLIFQRVGVIAPYLVAKGHVAIAGGEMAREALGSEPTGPIDLITDSRALSFVTDEMESLQTIVMGQESVTLERPYEAVNYRLASTTRFLRNQGHRISLAKGDVSIDGRGIFAFSGSAYFSPTPWLFDETVDAKTLELAYVAAKYVPPQSLGNGLFSQTLNIDLAKVYAPNMNLRWQLASPSISVEQPVTLRALDVRFSSEPLTLSNFMTKLKRYIERL